MSTIHSTYCLLLFIRQRYNFVEAGCRTCTKMGDEEERRGQEQGQIQGQDQHQEISIGGHGESASAILPASPVLTTMTTTVDSNSSNNNSFVPPPIEEGGGGDEPSTISITVNLPPVSTTTTMKKKDNNNIVPLLRLYLVCDSSFGVYKTMIVAMCDDKRNTESRNTNSLEKNRSYIQILCRCFVFVNY